MPRSPRVTEPGVVYHQLNRRVMRLAIFEKTADYEAFERVLGESLVRPDAPLLPAYCLMPNHWHVVVQAVAQTDLSAWMQWVTVTHTHRWHAHSHTSGEGPLDPGRFKSFPVEEDVHWLPVCRYVEANVLRAERVNRAEAWRWGSLWVRRNGPAAMRARLSEWPVARPRDCLAEVNRPIPEGQLKEVRLSTIRGTPLGTEEWRARIAARLGLSLTLRPRGRPRKGPEESS